MKKALHCARNIAAVCLLMFSVHGNSEQNGRDHKLPTYLYNDDQVRYELYQTNGGKNYNWLFLPGGPGGDSSYLHSLIDELKLPGNVWLIDLPGNGGNLQGAFSENYDHWFELFSRTVDRFDNPILVGHSFGGMFPLLFPELENHLKGLIILSSAPALWLEEAVSYSKQFDLPDLSKDIQEFTRNPNQDTFNTALEACMPYYFPADSLEKGKKLFSQITCRWQPAVWWQRKVVELNFSAKWIPQNVPTLIIGSKYDCICPFSLFKNDDRFHRPNIELLFIENAGHCPWIENPTAVRQAFEEFCSQLNTSTAD